MKLLRTLLIAGIPIVCALAVGAGLRAYIASSGPPPLRTVADAVSRRAANQMVELIRAGADPRRPIETTLAGVVDDRPMTVSPLMLAASIGDRDLVRLLLAMDIPWTEKERHDAFCVAVVTRSGAEPLLERPAFDRAACRDHLERLPGTDDGPCKTGFETFTASATFTVPTGCTVVTAYLWGGGGGGGAFRDDTSRGGGGGGGGAFAQKTVSGLVPGAPVEVVVAEGGKGGDAAGDAGSPGAPGGDSRFGSRVTAHGGAGGSAGATTRAAGGRCTGADVCHGGGAGGIGVVDAGDYANGGGGGGSGGLSGGGGDGGNATTNNRRGQPAGGAAGVAGPPDGGAGGRGHYGGGPGVAPGGGGGGGCHGSSSCPPGLDGGAGRMIVRWGPTNGLPSERAPASTVR